MELTYNDLKNYVLSETRDRDAGTYTSLGGCVVLKIEDHPDRREVCYSWYSLNWKFTYYPVAERREMYA